MVLPIFDQALKYCRIGERRSFASVSNSFLADLSRAGFGQTRRKHDDGIGSIFLYACDPFLIPFDVVRRFWRYRTNAKID